MIYWIGKYWRWFRYSYWKMQGKDKWQWGVDTFVKDLDVINAKKYKVK